MIVKISRSNYSVYAFDIETHNDIKAIKEKKTSMWLGCLINDESDIRDSSSYLYNMDEFLKRIEYLSTPKRHNKNETRKTKNICIYVYNLSFEWSFLLPYVLKWGFKFKEQIEDDDEMVFNTITTKSVSSVWSIQLKFHKNSGYVIFRDLSKIYGGGLGKVAKAFNLPTQKGSINYRKNRQWKRKPYKITCKEKVYCFKDVKILMDILVKLKDDKEFWQIFSMASYSMKKMIKSGYPNTLKPYKQFRNDYPELDQDETNFLRESVGGGITYAPSRWQFKDINEPILHIDCHQMHPSRMVTQYFPFGKGELMIGKPYEYVRYMNLCRIKISYDDVKIHSIIKLIGLDFIEGKEIVVWDFEIETMKKVYINLDIEYIEYYRYKKKLLPFRKYLLENYTKRLEAKKNKDEFYTLLYKLLNNASYGKFLEKPHNQIFINYINGEKCVDSIIENKDILNQKVNAKYTYLPVGSAIPAYSRVHLIETALKFRWEDILYFDTDSIFVLATKENMKVWYEEIPKTNTIGEWGLEEISQRGLFACPKRYKLEYLNNKGELMSIIKSGGFNYKNDVSYDEVNFVNSTWEVQRAFRCEGGTIIDCQSKKMLIQTKYLSIYENNILKHKEIKELFLMINQYCGTL